MIGQMIAEYLVGLGVQIDQPAFDELNHTINETTNTIESATGKWAGNFVKATGIISSAILSVSTAVGGLMKSAAEEDLEMEKLANNLMVSKEAAYEAKKAIDALGESVSSITMTPELMDRYKSLISDGRSMRLGDDFSKTAKNFRDLIFEFTRLKQEVSYAMTWIGYYLMKYLNNPLEDAKDKFRSFNDSFVKNMASWTEKAARALMYIINVGKHVLDLVADIGDSLKDVWDSLPKGVQKASEALAALWLVMKMSPLGRMILLVGSLFLLVDDYYGHLEGKQSALSKQWDKLNEYISYGKELWQQLKKSAVPLWNELIDKVELAANKLFLFVDYIKELIKTIAKSGEFDRFLNILKRSGLSTFNLLSEAVDLLITYIEKLIKTLKNNETLKDFWELFLRLVDSASDFKDVLVNLLRHVRETDSFEKFSNKLQSN